MNKETASHKNDNTPASHHGAAWVGQVPTVLSGQSLRGHRRVQSKQGLGQAQTLRDPFLGKSCPENQPHRWAQALNKAEGCLLRPAEEEGDVGKRPWKGGG